MTLIKVDMFKGRAPKIASRLLPEGMGTVVTNCRLDTGDIEPIHTKGADIKAGNSSWSGPVQTVYKYDVDANGDAIWFRWNQGVDVVRSPVAGNTNNRVYYTGHETSAGDMRPRVTNYMNALSGGVEPYPDVNGYRLGVPAPSQAPSVAVVGDPPATPENETSESRAYVYTFVTAFGEEGPPSMPSSIVNLYPVTQTTAVSGFDVAEPTISGELGLGYNITHKYIYRTVTTSGGTTEYQWVDSIPLAEATYPDSKLTLALGEVIPSTGWVAPPNNMKGLTSMSNGIMVAYLDNEVLFSEPFLPHAWPDKYRKSTDYPIVGVGTIGNTVVVTTEAYPYVASGAHPSNMVLNRLPENQACVSERSIVNMGRYVMYASPDGLVAVSGNTVKLATDPIMKRSQWQALKPETIHAYHYEGNYIAFYTVDGTQKCFSFDPEEGVYIDIDGLTSVAGAYNDPEDDALYLIDTEGAISLFEGGAANTYTWVSKEYKLASPLNMAAARIEAESYNDLVFKLYVDGELKHEETVSSDFAFRLPSGYRSNQFQFEVSGTDILQSVSVASSMGELIG